MATLLDTAAPYLVVGASTSFELRPLCGWHIGAPHPESACSCALLIRSITTNDHGQVEAFTLEPGATTAEYWAAAIELAALPGIDLIVGDAPWRYALSQC